MVILYNTVYSVLKRPLLILD